MNTQLLNYDSLHSYIAIFNSDITIQKGYISLFNKAFDKRYFILSHLESMFTQSYDFYPRFNEGKNIIEYRKVT